MRLGSNLARFFVSQDFRYAIRQVAKLRVELVIVVVFLQQVQHSGVRTVDVLRDDVQLHLALSALIREQHTCEEQFLFARLLAIFIKAYARRVVNRTLNVQYVFVDFDASRFKKHVHVHSVRDVVLDLRTFAVSPVVH